MPWAVQCHLRYQERGDGPCGLILSRPLGYRQLACPSRVLCNSSKLLSIDVERSRALQPVKQWTALQRLLLDGVMLLKMCAVVGHDQVLSLLPILPVQRFTTSSNQRPLDFLGVTIPAASTASLNVRSQNTPPWNANLNTWAESRTLRLNASRTSPVSP